jgi:hypothetical protein
MTTPSIQLLQSQRLSDANDGGGQMTSTVIPDNQADNLFDPISRINRSNGAVSLRKAFAQARTNDNKVYLGAHAIVSSPPTNAGVSALIFTTGSYTDERVDAAESIESYLVQGPQTRLWPYGTQAKGQRSIIAYQPASEPLPNVGDTYVIVNTLVLPNVTQFFRITSITSRVQTFTDTNGDFQLNVITMGIGAPLSSAYPGAVAQRYSTPTPPSVVCTTNVADAAVYHGVTMLTADASDGDETANLTSIFGQLLPSTQGESPVTNAQPLGAQSFVAAASAPSLLFRQSTFAGVVFAGSGMLPGSIAIYNDFGDLVAVDDGAGNVYLGTSPSTGTKFATVDYQAGRFDITGSFGFAANVHATPAASVAESPFSTQQPVTEGTRGYIYTETLTPFPTPKTTVVSYRALGKWYDLADDGSGTLVGADGAGTGTVRFDSGDCTVTLGALPDIGSSIVFSWGQGSQFDIRTGDVDIKVPAITLQLANGVKESTATITFTVAGVTKTVSDNGTGGLTGYGTGTIDYPSGLIQLRPTALPDPASGISVAYHTNPQTVQNLTPSKTGSDLVLTIAPHPVAPRSIRISYDLPIPSTLPASIGLFGASAYGMVITDDGAGGLTIGPYGALAGSSVNYSTGVVTFDPDFVWPYQTVPVYEQQPQWHWDATASPPQYVQRTVQVLVGYDTEVFTLPFVDGSAVRVASTASSASNVSTTESFASPSIAVDLTPRTVQPIVPGSVRFLFAGDTYIDRSGVLYRNINPATGAGTLAGAINYETGIATLTTWTGGGASTLSISALLTQLGILPIATLVSRAPGQSLRPASFQIRANRVSDGTLVTATADADGNWTTTDMTGHVDVTTGVFSVSFGQLVLDSSLTTPDKAEPWYNPANVDGTGHIWRPNEAIPGSIKFSCVVQTFLPLSASVLGLDPVRLPLDGRVQIVRPGDTLVFRNPLVFNVTGTPAASGTITLPRGNIESAVLMDANAVQVDTANYTVNLDTGVITMASSIDLSSYTGPFVVTHTTADMVLCTDVQITGQVEFTPGLTHDFPHTSTYVSGALIADNAGNLQADYNTLFEQTTWNLDPANLWDDVRHGSAPTASYDDVNHPIQVVDRDAITQRWALIFTSSTGGNIAGEGLGVIGTFSTAANVAPINDATSNPYFVLDHAGFGGGWSTGNAIRFNTVAAGFPIWFARCVQVGTVGSTDDSFATEIRWDEAS